MKKFLLIFTSIALLLAGCAKDESLKVQNEGEGTGNFTFSVSVPDIETKAVADGDGKADKVNHWVMEVLDSDGERYNYQDKDGAEGVLTNSFTVRLVKGQKYTVLFWADTKGAYDVTKLEEVKLLNESTYAANLDSRDAFSAVVSDFQTTQATAETVTLKRAVSQMNIIFTDLKGLFETMGSDPVEYGKFKPVNFIAEAKVPTTFNVKTQEAGAPAATALTITADSDYLNNYNTHREKETLFMDYIFSSATEKDLVDIDFSFTSKGVAINHSFTSIPFQRNYRTNILGEFMSANAQWTVDIDTTWAGEIDQQISMAGSIAAANEALKAGKTNISISSPADYSTSIALPAESNGKDIYFTLTGTSGKKISFQNETGEDGPANLFITADAGELDINTPKSHVEVITGTYSKVSASTSATTLVIKKDVTVNDLDIKAGNAEIHGIVSKITKAQTSVITYRIETVAALKNLRDAINERTWVAGKIYLEADIDLNNEEWAPIKAYTSSHTYVIDMDGQGYTIKNLKISGASGIDYIGFFDQANGLTVKDLNFDGANLTYPSAAGEGARGGVLVGNVWGINAENVNVKNVTMKACQKLGSLIGYIEGDTNVPNTVKNCSAENVSISSNDPNKILQHGSGGFIGHISQYQNPVTTISGCSVKNITIANYNTNPYSVDELQRVPHVFVGSVCQNYAGAETPTISSHSIVFENNTISGTNTVLPTCIYSSDYFGWAGNAEERPAWKGYVYIDGEKWTPDYAFECGGVKYNTLAQAVNAAPSDGTVNILKAGQYQLCGISKNITVKGSVEGVVFNCEGTGSICSIPNGVTFDGLEFVFGNNNYHGFYSAGKITFNDCTLNGYLVGYGAIEYNGCIVKQETEDMYSVQVYGNDFTSNNCEFFGTNKAILVYTEGLDHISNVTVSNCKFHASSSEDLKAAVQMNAVAGTCTGKYNTVIENCTIDGFAKVYGFKHNPKRVTATVTVDGKLVYDGTVSLSLGSAADLTEFAAAVNAGNTFSGKTVYLENDVDMTGIEWKPIGNVNGYPSSTFAGTFDGQNHTIANLTCDDKTVENASAGFFGSVTGDVKNLTMTDVTITSLHFAGAICGYCSTNCSVFENCHVIGGTITSTPENKGSEYDNGDKVGGIIGLSQSGEVIKNCSVENVTIRAYRDLGGICGASGASVTGCSVKNSSIIQDNTNAYKTDIDTYHEIVGRELGGFNASGNTYSNVTVKSEN